MNVDIYIPTLLKNDERTLGGGGIGTLIGYLLPVLEELGYEITVYQFSTKVFETTYDSATVLGPGLMPGKNNPTERVVKEWRRMAARRSGKERIELFAADFLAVPNTNPLAISIQNGLWWDASIDILTNKPLFRTAVGEKIFRLYRQYQGVRHFELCRNRVVADLYFLNWYRSFRGINYPGRIWYNPNPAVPSEWNSEREQRLALQQPIRILFARRFALEKGTRLIAEVFTELLRLRPHCSITLAGEDGGEREMFRALFQHDERVKIITYDAPEALAVHRQHDIAVIPSLCGEATSFAVSEALSAGCAVIATNFGGTITQIIDGYNGRLCFPKKEELLCALLYFIDNPAVRLRMQKNGWEFVQCAFPLTAWKGKWKSIIEEIVQSHESSARQ